MANLTFRIANPLAPAETTVKGEPLLNAEIDGNFKSLEDAKFEKTGGTITGNVIVNGTVDAQNFNSTSDARMKENIEQITCALDKIKLLSGYTFNFKNSHNGAQAGVIAQEVLPVISEVVKGSEENYYSVNYDGLIAYLIEAVKELSDKVDALSANKE